MNKILTLLAFSWSAIFLCACTDEKSIFVLIKR